MAYYDVLITKWATLVPGTTAQKLADLNSQTVNVAPTSMIVPSWVIYNAIVPAEFQALSATLQQLVRDVLTLGNVDVSNSGTARAVLLQVFVAGSQTRANFAAAQAALNITVPWTTANGYPPINRNDLTASGLS